MTSTPPADAVEILDYWFGPITADGMTRDDRYRLWFSKDEAQDSDIRRRFAGRVEQALAGRLDHWSDTPEGRLALVISLDQFTRNIYRDTPRAFSGDPLALDQTLAALDRGEDRRLPLIQRVFLYLPLEHAESADMQAESVRRFERLAADAPAAHKALFDGFFDYAYQHRDVIARYGRFPHRNHILGRESTVNEQEYLQQPGAGF